MQIVCNLTMAAIFRLISPAPLSLRVPSRESCTYLNRIINYIGWSPQSHQGWRRYIYLFWSCLSTGFITFYLPIGFLLSLVKDFGNINPEEFLAVLQVSFNVIGESAKIIVLLIFISRLQETESILDTLDTQVQSESDRWIIHRAVARSNYIFIVYMFVYLGYPGFACLAGIINNRPAFMIYNPLFDWRNGRVLMWIQSILENVIMTMAVLIGLVLDTYTIIFITMFRAHFNVLKDRIRNLRSDPLKTEADNYEDLVGCILYHKGILR